MDWRASTGITGWCRPEPVYRDVYAYEPIQYEGPASQIAQQVYRTVAENLKVFVRELTDEIKNGTLVFDEQDIERRIDELFLE